MLLLLSIFAIFQISLASIDVNRAFLHPPLKRGDAHAKPPAEFGFKSAALLLLKVAHGLNDAPRALFEHLFLTLKSFGRSALPSDPCAAHLPKAHLQQQLSIIISHADGMLAASNSRARPILDGISKKLESNGQKSLPFMLNGLHASQKQEALAAHQFAHIASILSASPQQIVRSADIELTDEGMPLFRKITGSLQWAARGAAPMHAAAAATLQAGIRPRAYGQLRQLMRIFQILHDQKPALQFPAFHQGSLHLRGCSDGSCKTVDRSISGGRYLAFLADQEGKCHLLLSKAYSIPAQYLSATGAEAEPCMRLLDQLFVIRGSIKRLISVNLPARLCADSSSVLNGATTSKSMEDPKIAL